MPPDTQLLSPSRRNFLKALGMTAAIGLINACTNDGATATTAAGGTGGTGSTAATGGSGAGNFPETPAWEFVFVNHVTTNPFFVPTVYGIEDAAAMLGIPTPQWTGSEDADNGAMVNAMEAAIAGAADGIGVCLVDLEAFNGPTDEALAAGIPVIAYNADTPPDNPNNRLCYVGQDLYGSGFEMGNRIVELVGSGKVALFIATPGQLNIQPRIDGALDAIAESGADIEAIDIATGAALEEELSTVEAWYLGNQDATGMFAVDAGSTQAVGQVVRDQSARDNGLVGAGGYDLLAGDGGIGLRGSARLHHRPAALSAGVPTHRLPLPVQAVGWRGHPAGDQHRSRVPRLLVCPVVPGDGEPVRRRCRGTGDSRARRLTRIDD